jgi:hypothetical protein
MAEANPFGLQNKFHQLLGLRFGHQGKENHRANQLG